jgi:hypothetical protein
LRASSAISAASDSGSPILYVCALFYLTVLFPAATKVPYIKSLERTANAIGIKVPANKNWSTVTEAINLPTGKIMQILKLPKEMGEYNYCISHRPFTYDVDEQPVQTHDILILQLETGSIIEIKPEEEKCFDRSPNARVAGFIFDAVETTEQAKKWGVRNSNENTDELSAFSKIRSRIKLKDNFLLFFFPFAITTLWWGLLSLFINLKNNFIDKEKKEEREYL